MANIEKAEERRRARGGIVIAGFDIAIRNLTKMREAIVRAAAGEPVDKEELVDDIKTSLEQIDGLGIQAHNLEEPLKPTN